MATAKKPAMRATSTFHAAGGVTVYQDAIVPGDDPLVRQFPQFFADANDATRGDVVHTATARPGEVRGVRSGKD